MKEVGCPFEGDEFSCSEGPETMLWCSKVLVQHHDLRTNVFLFLALAAEKLGGGDPIRTAKKSSKNQDKKSSQVNYLKFIQADSNVILNIHFALINFASDKMLADGSYSF